MTLKKLYDDLKPDMKDFEYLSMGMSNDYEIAIEEGANMIRIGSANIPRETRFSLINLKFNLR
ncbi:MAG: hypothetical protein R3A12_07225 [Ignavibacteria bacterium]